MVGGPALPSTPSRHRRGAVLAAAALIAGAALSAVAPHRPATVVRVPAPPVAAPHALPDTVPAAPDAPAAIPPAQAPAQLASVPFDERTLRPHEIFGFAPYWNLGAAAGYPLRELTTVAYFGVDVNADGSLLRSGSGWDGYTSDDLTSLVAGAHRAGDAVVLTAKQMDAATLHSLVTTAGTAARLGHELVDAVRARRMDGVNLDLEGLGDTDRSAFAAFAITVANTVHAAEPHWQVTLCTYTNSANDGTGYFDVARLAPAFDALFVMAYDMQGDNPSAVAPLQGAPTNDSESVAGYSRLVGPSKVILGMPFYGVDWPTRSGDHAAAATGPPSPVTYAQVAAAGHPRYWDPVADAPWTSYQDPTGQWHLAYYEDPQSIAMKAELADSAHLRGVGIWALGMDGNDAAMARAVLGRAAPVKLALGPASPAPAPAPAPVAQAAPPPPPRQNPGPQPPSSPAKPAPPRPAPVPAPAPPVPLPSPAAVPQTYDPWR